MGRHPALPGGSLLPLDGGADRRAGPAWRVVGGRPGLPDRDPPNGHASTSTYLGGHGDALRELGRYEEAEAKLTLAYENARKVGNDHLAGRLIGSLVMVYEAWGKPDLAATWRAKLSD